MRFRSSLAYIGKSEQILSISLATGGTGIRGGLFKSLQEGAMRPAVLVHEAKTEFE